MKDILPGAVSLPNSNSLGRVTERVVPREGDIADKPMRVRVEVVRQTPRPPTSLSFGMFKWLRRMPSKQGGKGISGTRTGTKVDRATADGFIPSVLATRPHVLANELSVCVAEAEEELRLQQRSVRAADAVLCSAEPVIGVIEENIATETVILEQLMGVANSIQQVGVLTEMTEAVDAAKIHLDRLEVLAANVRALHFVLTTYIGPASNRYFLMGIVYCMASTTPSVML